MTRHARLFVLGIEKDKEQRKFDLLTRIDDFGTHVLQPDKPSPRYLSKRSRDGLSRMHQPANWQGVRPLYPNCSATEILFGTGRGLCDRSI